MANVVLMLGGNVGDVSATLARAVESIGIEIGTIMRLSKLYVTKPWGFDAADDFVNQAVVVQTLLSPEELLDAVNRIESSLDRDRDAEAKEKLRCGKRYTSRTIDIDIILYEDLIYASDRLAIPHPHMDEREFVLEPVSEIVPELKNPITGLTILESRERLRRKMKKID